MSGKKGKQRVPLDLFLSGMLAGSLGEMDHPVIVVDESKRRMFPGHRVTDKSFRSHSNSSFCSSVTSCSFTSNHSQAALCASRWESMPGTKADTALGAPPRTNNSGLCLRRPSRTHTNDLKKNSPNVVKPIRKTPSKVPLQKREMFLSSPIRRARSMRCDSMRSKERVAKLHASL